MPDTSSDDNFQSDDGGVGRLSGLIKSCLSEKPQIENKSKNSVRKLKSQLDKCRSTNKQRISSRIGDRKQVDEFFKELSTDILKLTQKTTPWLTYKDRP